MPVLQMHPGTDGVPIKYTLRHDLLKRQAKKLIN